MRRPGLLLSIALIALASPSLFAAPKYIIILRHGEKINDKIPHLSPQGYKRAKALATELQSERMTSKYGRPAALFAASDAGGRSQRSIETLQPLGQALNLPVNRDYSKGEEKKLIKDIRENKDLDDKTIVIAWAHEGISDFLKEFDIDGLTKKKRKWRNDIFDQFWILENLPKGKWSLVKVGQALLPGDEGYCSVKMAGRAQVAPRPQDSN